MKHFLWFFCLLFLMSGCASKRYTKKASKFEDAGLYKDASDYYYEAVKRKDSNVEAKLGLRKNGQITLDNKLDNFQEYYNQGNNKQAVYMYLNAEAYYEKIKAVGVELGFPEKYHSYYIESKNNFLGDKYIHGMDLLNREEFSLALSVFTEIKNIDENYKDIKEKYITAKFEPKYREAIDLIDNGHYRQAYYTFDYILKNTNDYKQAQAYKDDALEKGTLAILVTEFTFTRKQNQVGANYITSLIGTKLSELNNPFLKLIDPATLDVAIYKSRGVLDMRAANLAGIHAVLSGEIIEYVSVKGKLLKTSKKGYIKEVIKLKNDAGVESESITYHKTEYMEYQAKNKARLNLNYKLVSTSNKEILVTNSFNRNKTDEVHYAIFEGEKEKLVPGNWKFKDSKSIEDIVKDDKKEVRKLQRLLDARQEIKPSANLRAELINQAISAIVSRVDKYNPENK